MGELLHRWLDTVQTERAGRNQAPLNLTDFLSEETQASDAQELEDTLDQEAKRVGPMEEAFMTIVRLAGSIRRRSCIFRRIPLRQRILGDPSPEAYWW